MIQITIAYFSKTSDIFSNFVLTLQCNVTMIHQNHNLVQRTSGPLGPFLSYETFVGTPMTEL